MGTNADANSESSDHLKCGLTLLDSADERISLMNESGITIGFSVRKTKATLSARDACGTAQAFVHSHHPVVIDATHLVRRNGVGPNATSAPVNHLYAIAFPDNSFTDTAQADTGKPQPSLWSNGPDEPHLISIPQRSGRYHLLEMIWSALVDDNGRTFDSGGKYVLHFRKHEIPPVRGFWSLAMYNDRQSLAGNPIDRYAVGNRDPLKFYEDGSLDLYIQRDCPTRGKKNNWLPSPRFGGFTMILHLHWPKPEALHGSWMTPTITREES